MSARAETDGAARDADTVRVALRITGLVQGVGFRPSVARIAAERGLTGFVLNDSRALRCELEGARDRVEAAVAQIRDAPPPLARIDSVLVETTRCRGDSGFTILASDADPDASLRTLVSPDIATCADCLRELLDPRDRRHLHPFITCTNCGPRYTVITDLPYDRPATTMSGFAMCELCAAEYRDPADRRYHAQTIACPQCGPRLSWRGPGDGPALASAAAALQGGLIVAVKGIGGYHLACRADDDEVLTRLRRRKNRPAKPFAVMAADLSAAGRIARVTPAAARSLCGPSAPIVVLPAQPDGLGALVAPGLRDVGVMLAYSPLHHLLFRELAGTGLTSLVMTSANQGGSPIVYRDEDLHWIDGLADAVLTHDRPIHVPCEDSVVTTDDDGYELPIRRSRGYAPLPVSIGTGRGADEPLVLATGGDLKTTFALAGGDGRAHLSSHLGDMADPRTQRCFTEAVDHLTFLTGAPPTVVAHDRHPGYATTRWAQRQDLPVLEVQHHHAHAVSLLAEYGRLGHPMVAVTYDGTGYGPDGTIWGGELLAVGADPTRFTRVGHLATFLLPGGDGAVRQPARIAVDLMTRAGLTMTEDLPPVAALGAAGMRMLSQQLPREIGCVPTTSMGRLFDAVASLLGVCQQVSYEGQAAIELEHLARGAQSCGVVDFDVCDGVLDPAPVIAALTAGLVGGTARPALAAAFHDAVVRATVRAATAAARRTGIPTVGLTGGVFANRRLLAGITTGLRGCGLEVLTHRVVPCNDGGLALGQAAIAAATLARGATTDLPVTRERSGRCASGSPAR